MILIDRGYEVTIVDRDCISNNERFDSIMSLLKIVQKKFVCASMEANFKCMNR